MTPNIQKPKVVSVLLEKHNIVYAVAQKHEKAVMLLHYFVISWLEEGDLRVWIHYRYSTGVKKLPRYWVYVSTTWLWSWWKTFTWLSMTSMKSQVILGKLKIFISAYAWWRTVSRLKFSSCATSSESEGSWNLADVIIYLFVQHQESQVIAVLLPICIFVRWYHLSRHVSRSLTSHWIILFSCFYEVCLLQAAHNKGLSALYSRSSIQQPFISKFFLSQQRTQHVQWLDKKKLLSWWTWRKWCTALSFIY